jgi:hypothetical protein
VSGDLAAFLKARLDENETSAREAAVRGARWSAVKVDDEELGDAWWMHPPFEAHVRRHDPARVLREVEAVRKLLGLHVPIEGVEPPQCIVCLEYVPCDTLRFLAAVYSDHPDYRQEWAPTVTAT